MAVPVCKGFGGPVLVGKMSHLPSVFVFLNIDRGQVARPLLILHPKYPTFVLGIWDYLV